MTYYYCQEIQSPENLYQEVIEVEERLVLHQEKYQQKSGDELVTGTTGEKVSTGSSSENVLRTGII